MRLSRAFVRYPFDTILMAVNAADPHTYSFNDGLLPSRSRSRWVSSAMKIPGRGRLLSTWTPPPIDAQKHSWEGMTIQTSSSGTLKMREAIYYTLSKPVSTVIIGCDSIPQLEENVQYAREFTPLNEAQQTEWLARAEACAKPSLFFASTTARKCLRCSWSQPESPSQTRGGSGLLSCAGLRHSR